jgi:hypothetical protein
VLKRDITYEDFDGNKVTEPYYFNLTKSELVELDASYNGGVQAVFQRIVETRDSQEVIKEFKQFILAAYGIKSDDGKRFVKNDQIREEFTQTAAYDALFMELATNDVAAATFITGVMPKDFTSDISSEVAIQVPPLAPPAPPAGPTGA